MINRDSTPPPAMAATAKVLDMREDSSVDLLTPRAQLERIVLRLTEAGLAAYRDAAKATKAGEHYGAGLLRDAARRSIETAHDITQELDAIDSGEDSEDDDP
jgi:hypothetical protein